MSAHLQKYNLQVPRYTSYPTSPHFHDGVSAHDYENWLSNIPEDKPISLYLHIPFCKQLCWYCGCHTKITHNTERVHSYTDVLIREIKMVRARIGKKISVSHIAWGGGTPNYLSTEDFTRIMNAVRQHFFILDSAEIAVECDPRVLSNDMITTLAENGINRVSLGVQDFDLTVQEAINRVQPFTLVKEKVEALRTAGINSINFDLIYGLPKQTHETISETVRLTKELMPERVAVFGYAHVPWMKKHQKLMERFGLPEAPERRDLEQTTRDALINAGYDVVGLDHFALPHDTMAVAVKDGTLKRNFQGYTTDTSEYLIGFGASAISCVPEGYAANDTDILSYEETIMQGNLTTKRGIATSEEDVFRRRIIMEIMGSYALDTTPYASEKISDALIQLNDMEKDGLIEWQGKRLVVTELGRPFVRTIASVFDGYLNLADKKHSQAV